MIERLVQLPSNKSFFLFGPRQTGKSSLVNTTYAENAWVVNLLRTEEFVRYSKHPEQYRLDVEQKIRSGLACFVLDEVQRVPGLLHEVQALIDKYPGIQFVMLGSSARKLKRGGANLLGGRALQRYLHPFTVQELGDQFDLDDMIRFGSLPPLLGRTEIEKQDILRAYTDTYLREEIQMEGLVRNLGGFYRFLETAGSVSGELLNFSNVARECQLPVKTVQSYYEILEDTLIGFRLLPWMKSERKRLVGHPKFYFFDTGVTNAVNRRLSAVPDSALYGRLFEQFLVLELQRQIAYSGSESRLFFWRTNTGAEVDLLIERHGKLLGAFECKSSREVGGNDFSGLRSLRSDYPDLPLTVLYRGTTAYTTDGIHVLPFREFFQQISSYL